MLGQTAEILHASHNSHSQMIDEAKWRVNKPNETIRVFEAEWDGLGAFPSDNALIRNAEECPEKLKEKMRNHFKKLQAAISEGKHLTDYFLDTQKYADVWGQIKTLPDGVTFPADCKTLYLSSLTSLPDGVTFPADCRSLDLSSLTTLPEGVTFPADCRSLDLSSLTTLPEGVTFPAKCEYLDLSSGLKAAYYAAKKAKK
jgi:hypothetical protein